MIYTVTLSPALDYLIWLDQFESGELNRTEQVAFRAGGKGINVSTVLSRLGVESICLGFTAGFVGNELIRLLDTENIRHNFIQLKEGCSRINVKLKADKESEINASGPVISNTELKELEKQAQKLEFGDFLVLSGNPPKNIPFNIYSILMDSVSKKNIRIIVDSSGDHLVSALSRHPFLIKPNKAELEEIFSTKLDSIDQIVNAALKLKEKGAANVLVSLGGDGAMLAADNGQIFTCAVPEGTLIDSTGAGDSMVAGFIAKEIENCQRDECLRFAVACGCASAYSSDLLNSENLKRIFEKTPYPIPYFKN